MVESGYKGGKSNLLRQPPSSKSTMAVRQALPPSLRKLCRTGLRSGSPKSEVEQKRLFRGTPKRTGQLSDRGLNQGLYSKIYFWMLTFCSETRPSIWLMSMPCNVTTRLEPRPVSWPFKLSLDLPVVGLYVPVNA